MHRDNGRMVAVKVLRPEFADNPEYREGFHQEVRSIARMNHEAIVDIYDYGIVDQKVGRLHPELETGALWLAMEFAPKGSLEEWPPITQWEELRDLLLEILDALAYAHARYLVHRDLKPENVLRRPSRRGEKSEGWMLSDFGIAHINDAAPSRNTGDMSTASAGTPLFMAPEQLQGEWRDFGPWTDLYALGCLTFYLVTGRPPFDGKSAMAVALAHMSDAPPRMQPRLAVPTGFDNWVRRLLVKDMKERYRRAADAASDLRRLGDPTPEQVQSHLTTEPLQALDNAGPTEVMATFVDAPTMQTRQVDSDKLRKRVSADRLRAGMNADIEPLPTRVHLPGPSWRCDRRGRGTSLMPGAGKGIFGLRQPPYVGRVDARNHLWSEFRRVCAEERSRLVIIRGDLGLDKSRLLRWMARRAHEAGHANALVATYSPKMAPGAGLPQTFCAHLGGTGLDRARLYERLEAAYRIHLGEERPDPHHLAAVVEWMMPKAADDSDNDEIPRVRLESPMERHMVVRELLRHICARRPLIIGIEEGQWAGETLGLVKYLLSMRDEHRLPVFVMVTMRPGAIKERPAEREYLELISRHDYASQVELEPLAVEEQKRFLEHLIGLEDSLVEEVSARCGGTSLYAVQLVEDWVIRDVLRSTPRGYTLVDGEEIPKTLDELLERRLLDVAHGWEEPDEAQLAMEVAGALGVYVDEQLWRRTCEKLGVVVSDEYVDHLMAHGVTRRGSGGWRFRLPRYCDCLEQMARDNGRWRQIHSTLADELAARQDEVGHGLEELRARHLLEARRFDDAVPLLWRAFEAAMQQSAYVSAQALLSLLDRAFDGLGYDDDHPQRVRAELRRAETERFRGNFSAAKALVEQVWDRAAASSPALRAESHRIRGLVENFGGDYAAALEDYRRAYELYSSVGDENGMLRSLSGMGWMHLAAGRHIDAHAAFEESMNRARKAGDELERAWSLLGSAQALIDKAPEEGGSFAREALRIFDEKGCRSGMAIAHRTVGDYVRREGDVENARAHYRRAQHLARMTGHALAEYTQALLAFCDLSEGDLVGAQRRFSEFLKATKGDALPAFRPVALAGLLVIAAHRRDVPAFDHSLDRLGEDMQPKSLVRRELLELLKEARRVCDGWAGEEWVCRLEDLIGSIRGESTGSG